MVDSFEVRVMCPSVSFLFACLGASSETSNAFLPLIENFIFEVCGLGVVVGELFHVLSQSINWFWGLIEERKRMSEVRSSELETKLSPNDGPTEEDTVGSSPREVRSFHAFEEVCRLDVNTLGRFKDRFHFLKRVKVCLPNEEDRACHFFPGEVCFYVAAFVCGLRFPIHPFLIELLDHFGIAPGQLMPNFWRIVVSCMRIWPAVTDVGMLKVDVLFESVHEAQVL